MNELIIKGARENNLKNINLTLPKNKLIVMTGVSGSGKSSLAFDTIYAEGQRRYVESLSAYARQFLGGTFKPDVDSIEGLSPAISIDQKTTNKNPRSTVGTVTEIYDYLRLLYARIGVPYCPTHHIPISSQSIEEMVNQILKLDIGTKILVLSPIVSGEKGTHKDTIENIKKNGYVRLFIDNKEYEIEDSIILDKNKKHQIEVVIDRLIIKEDIRARLYEAIELATKMAKGKVIIKVIDGDTIVMSEKYACPLCDFSLPDLEPRMFSYNTPYGACPECNGLGIKLKMDLDLVIPDKNLSINEGAIKVLNTEANILSAQLEAVSKYYKIDLNTPIKDIPKDKLDIILYGSKDIIEYKYTNSNGSRSGTSKDYFEGIITNLERRYIETKSEWIREWLSQYMAELQCPVCKGARLNKDVLAVLIGGKNIYEMTNLSITDLYSFLNNLKLNKEEQEISKLILKDILARLKFLINVGLEYLSLSRMASTLSGGEASRIRLATQIGSQLTGILYVLDEPSIGLHQKDNQKLIDSLLAMRDLGNTLIVVEHDLDTMRQADYLVDIGPLAGNHGGEVIAAGTPQEVMANDNSITGRYLSGKDKIEVPKQRRKGNGKYIELVGCRENNLKNIKVKFPLNRFICVTGVSGSGKSTLVNKTLYQAIANNLYKVKERPGEYSKILGLENIDKIVDISQDPIGRTPRSNPGTYVGLFDDIRELFATTKEAKMRGYDKSRFSFNVKGGRCEACQGDGVKKIEMHFLPDVYVPCEVCGGLRYNKETLSIKYKDKNIADVLDMRVEEALDFFQNIPKIKSKLQMLMDTGLSYIKIGQASTTLSGGEASRIKLAKELQRKATGKSLFILDEPTTGLHNYDIKNLLAILNRIVDNGDTVIVIEHNLEVIKQADYVIDLGPNGGDNGGKVIASGTPEEITRVKESYTGMYLKKILEE